MNGTDSLDALRRANPRHKPDFTRMATDLTRGACDPRDPAGRVSRDRVPRSRRSSALWPAIGVPAAAALTVVVVAAVLAVGSPVGSPAVSPAAAIQHAATVSAQAAEQSGTVSIHMTRDGAQWAAKTVRWNGSDISITNDDPSRPGRGDVMVVDGTLYGPDPTVAGGWLELGSPASIDPDSGTTPDEYLAAVREDAGGDTFRRITEAMTDLTTTGTDDGSTVYRGTVPAGVLARESDTKEGAPIRVLPYGYVAHDDAHNPDAPVDVSITVRRDNTIAEIHATWGGASAWTYRLSFSALGSTPPPVAPEDARPPRCVDPSRPCPPAIPPGG
jgi:hypothetical protein